MKEVPAKKNKRRREAEVAEGRFKVSEKAGRTIGCGDREVLPGRMGISLVALMDVGVEIDIEIEKKGLGRVGLSEGGGGNGIPCRVVSCCVVLKEIK